MMKAIKNFMNKQWTWGTYFKLCGVVAGVYCALIGGIVAWEKWKERKELKKIRKSTNSKKIRPLPFLFLTLKGEPSWRTLCTFNLDFCAGWFRQQ